MKRFNLSKIRNVLISVVLANCVAYAWAGKVDSPTVSKRIDAVRTLALAFDADAQGLMTFVQGKGDWASHAAEDRKIALDMGNAEVAARELMEMIEIASPRQEAVIHKVVPLLRDLANNTRLTLEHIKIKPSEAHSPSCIEYVEAHRDLAKHLASQITDTIPLRR
jgi:hypothetical protein